MLVAEFFEDRPAARGCATRETAEGLRAVIFSNGRGDRTGLAALIGADRDWRSGERHLIRLHQFAGTGNPAVKSVPIPGAGNSDSRRSSARISDAAWSRVPPVLSSSRREGEEERTANAPYAPSLAAWRSPHPTDSA